MDIRPYLEQHGIRYEMTDCPDPTDHSFVKPVILKADGEFILCALPACDSVDLERLRLELHADDLCMAEESELREQFGEQDLTDEPPIGWLYGLPMVIDESLMDDARIVFPAGHDHRAISMRFLDFYRLAHPAVAHVGHHISP